jgi:hypothetical protein
MPRSSFASTAEELLWLCERVKDLSDTLRETEASLVEFEESSKDVEREMDREIRDAERRERELNAKDERNRSIIDEWKVRAACMPGPAVVGAHGVGPAVVGTHVPAPATTRTHVPGLTCRRPSTRTPSPSTTSTTPRWTAR